ncbi:MAG: response regulator [Chitinophagaceae bacterium]|nr:response regulator [Chitinophagaceae bacterium]
MRFYSFVQGLYGFLRNSGTQNIPPGRNVRQIVYTNIIWCAALVTLTVYAVANIFFAPVHVLTFVFITLGFESLFILCFLLVRNGFVSTGKHLLICSVYLAVLVYDHLSGKSVYAFLYLFAFSPTALNIFSVNRKSMPYVGFYVLFPLVYTLATTVFNYHYPSWPLTHHSMILLRGINISLAFLLFLLFTGYIILNNLAKQNKLKIESLGLQTTLDNSAAAIWSINRQYQLMSINKQYIDSIAMEFGVSGLKRGVDIQQHPIWQKLTERMKQQYQKVLEGEEVFEEVQLNDKHYEIKGVPVYDNNKNIAGASFESRDITIIRKSEKVLLKSKKDAEEAATAKARFLSNMSHELRTPLNGIAGITRIMQDEKCLPEQMEHFKTLQDLSDHTLQLVNNILDFAKIEAGKATLDHKRFNLLHLVEKVKSIFSATAQLKGLKFIVKTNSSTDIYVKGDEVRISQVLINMLGNALKFTIKGSVTLQVTVAEENNIYQQVRFEVIDTGIGIKPENMSKIFESFNQGSDDINRKFGGTGLGLSITEKILNLMDSGLKVESSYGKGTTSWFDIKLPKSSHEVVRINYPDINTPEALNGVKILVAEDNRINQMVAQRMLQKWKAEVTIVSNGAEALTAVNEHVYDLILMDLDMPVMDGYESVALLRESLPEMPVIALTAASFEDMEKFLTGKGFNEVVQKPFMPHDLLQKIITVLRKSDRRSVSNYS